MARIRSSAPLLACTLALVAWPVLATPAIDESLAETAQRGVGTEAGAIETGVAELPEPPPPAPSGPLRYGETLAEPLEAAVNSLTAPSTPARVLLMGSGSVLAGSGATDALPAEAPMATEGLLPVDANADLGLPAPVDLGPR